MLIGLLSDAHGNAVSLAECLRELERTGASALRFLGDAVGYLPGERAVLSLLATHEVDCQQGNHEAMLLGRLPLDPVKDGAYGLTAARRRLGAGLRARISAWPTRVELVADGRRLLLVHGSPWDELRGYVYPDSDLTGFAGLPYDAVFMGNTHRPFVTRVADTLVVNVGSCGLPRDQGDLPSFAVYDTQSNDCNILRVHVDPRDALNDFGAASIHESVLACLARRSMSPYGSVVLSG